MSATDSITTDPRRFSIRLPRPLWIGVAAVGLAAFASLLVWMFRTPGREFDEQLWYDYGDLNQAARYPRLEMADRLVATGKLRGQSLAEVVDIFGEPPETTYFRDWDLVYWLGPERGFMSIDSEWLVVRFDTQDRVAGVEIDHDDSPMQEAHS